ncbi:MAG: HDOD domain-containing protein [Planctomycetota bacterium]
MAFQGNNDSLSAPDLFGFLVHQQLSGLLIIASHTQERCFCFNQGQLAYAMLNDPGQLMGDVLVRELNLEERMIDDAIGRHSGSVFLGEALAQEGILTHGDVATVIGRQIRRALREVLRWKTWAFHFHEFGRDDKLPDGLIGTQSLVLNLAHEIDEWNRISEIFFDLDQVLKRTSESLHSRAGREWPEGMPSPGKLLLEADGRKSIRTLLEESAVAVYPLASALHLLVQEGAITLLPPERAGAGSEDYISALALPMVPNLAPRILALYRQENPEQAEIRELILQDPVLTAKTLRLAGLRRRGEAAVMPRFDDLLTRLGGISIKAVLLAEAARRAFLAPCQYTWHRQWTQAYMTSIAAHAVASAMGEEEPEHAQIAGLLLDIGSMVLAAVDTAGYRKVLDLVHLQGVELVEAENRVFQTDHTRVGALLADSWGFPAPLKSTIREHHSPLEHPRNTLLGAVRLAALMAQPDEEVASSYKQIKRLARQLGLSTRDLEEVQSRTKDVCRRLDTTGVLS